MTLAEAIKAKQERPGRILRNDDNCILQFGCCTVFTTVPGENRVISIPLDGWEIVQEQPVPWQEALQAWIDRKSIRIECSKSGGPLFIDGGRYYFDESPGGGVPCKDCFESGKWYIIEE